MLSLINSLVILLWFNNRCSFGIAGAAVIELEERPSLRSPSVLPLLVFASLAVSKTAEEKLLGLSSLLMWMLDSCRVAVDCAAAGVTEALAAETQERIRKSLSARPKYLPRYTIQDRLHIKKYTKKSWTAVRTTITCR